MRLEELVEGIPNFSSWTHADKIRFFGWFLHSLEEGHERFSPADIRSCYDRLSLEKPRDVNPYLHEMLVRRPREVLRDSKGYALERRVRDSLESRFGKRTATIRVDRLLLELPAKIKDTTERVFLDEAIRCLRCQAFRATMVMSWNLAYDHFCEYLLKESGRLGDFNAQLPKSFPKARVSSITKRDDFGELKEWEVLQTSRSANIISSDLFKILKEKLDKRNTAAHPSTVQIAPHTAEEYVIDLVTNAVLKLV